MKQAGLSEVQVLANGKLACTCGNKAWRQFLYVGSGADVIGACCKRCGANFEIKDGSWQKKAEGIAKKLDAAEATKLLADEAERLGADAGDDKGVVRRLVLAHGLSFFAWFCVCCELADRQARRAGFKDQFEMAAQSPKFQAALADYAERHGGRA